MNIPIHIIRWHHATFGYRHVVGVQQVPATYLLDLDV
eukprot:COSAG05_NODE_17169_length_330_cov_0.935065_1_plen_36_part_10